MNRQAESHAAAVKSPVRGGLLQRKCACGQHAGGGECEECKKKKKLQRQRNQGTEPSEVPPVVHEVLRSAANPLDARTRGFMESRFGRDFSQVRVHTDVRAAAAARSVNALAYTVGQHVVFGAGQYAPSTTAGRRLLAHELTHTVQQGNGAEGVGLREKLEVSMPGDIAECEADSVAEAVVNGSSRESGAGVKISAAPTLQRTCADGQCDDCTGGRRDFWVTVFFRRRATAATMRNLRAQINEAKTILRNCCLDLKFDFDWRLLRGPSTFPAPAERPAGDPLGSLDYSADSEALGEGTTFSGARGVPMLVVDDVPGSGGGVSMLPGLDAEYTGRNYFALAVNQADTNLSCNRIAHELWHMTGATRHDETEGPITACTNNDVSLTYCNALRGMVGA